MKPLRDDILKTIEEEWPASVTEVAKRLGLIKKSSNERVRKAAVAKVAYHVKKLSEQEKIRTKKIGKTVIMWPTEIEKIRVIHEMMR